jgi:hypothetical protein
MPAFGAAVRALSGVQVGAGAVDVGGGVGVIGIDDAATVPTTNPTSGVIAYSESGTLKWRDPAGTVRAVSTDTTKVPLGGGTMTGDLVMSGAAVTSPTVRGATGSAGTLTLSSTSHATKGKILLGTSAYDEVNNRLGIGNSTPGVALDVTGQISASTIAQAPTIQGGTGSAGTLTLVSTTHGTKGKVLFGTSAYDEVNNRLGVATATPAVALDVVGAVATTGNATIGGDLSVVGIGQSLFVRKTADTTRNNNATIADDPHLTLAVDANCTYVIRAFIIYSSTTQTPDIQFRFNSPASSTLNWAINGITPANANQDTSQNAGQIRTIVTTGSGSTRSIGTLNASHVAMPEGILRTAGTAGSLVFGWAQLNATVEDTKVLTDSYMQLTRVA